MKTKTLYIVLLLTLISGIVQAQQNGLAIQLGYVRPLLREQGDPSKLGSDGKKLPNILDLNGAKIGVVYDATIIKGFGVTMGLNYTLAGANDSRWTKLNSAQIGEYPKIRNSYLYQSIEVPIDWQYKFEIAQDTYLLLYTGPTLQYNFYFKNTTYTKRSATSQAEATATSLYDIDKDKDDKLDYSQFNITWSIGAGFQYDRYFLRGGYEFGIYNPYKDRFFNYGSGEGYYNRGRFDQWVMKIGMYLF